MMTFEQLNLNPRIFKALSICGYTTPTSVQSRAIPEVMNGRDVVASAQTGTGKTAAFVLPALDMLANTESKGKPRILILTPTRELATQITDAVARYGKFLQPKIISLLGGMPYHKQLQALSRPLDIIIATPGRLLDHMERRRVDLSGIEMLILDEADRMLDMGFIDDVTAIANKTPKTRQTLLFSATVDNKLSHVVRNLLNEPVRIDLATEKLTPAKITQDLYFADNPQHKMQLLMHLLENENMYKAIIFSATKINADRLAKELSDMDYPALPLHGDLKQNQRNKTVEQLRRGKVQFVVATDVASRGIDISDVTHVINFDLPRFSEDYVHRIGRTGRAGKTGVAISLVLPSDTKHLKNIERYIGKQLTASIIPGLEPTKRQKGSDKSGPSRKRSFGSEKSGASSGKRSFSKNGPRRSNSSDNFSGEKKFGDSRRDSDRFGGEKKFGDSKRGSDKFGGEKKFGDSRRDSDRFGGEKKFGDSRRGSDKFGGEKKFGDSRRGSDKFGSEKKFGDSRRGSDKFGGEKKFGDSRRGSANFGGEKKFGDSKRGSDKFGGEKKFGDSRRDSDRFGGEKKFGDSRRGSDKFGGEKKFGDSRRGSDKFGSEKKFGDSRRGSDKFGGEKKFGDSRRGSDKFGGEKKFGDSRRDTGKSARFKPTGSDKPASFKDKPKRAFKDKDSARY